MIRNIANLVPPVNVCIKTIFKYSLLIYVIKLALCIIASDDAQYKIFPSRYVYFSIPFFTLLWVQNGPTECNAALEFAVNTLKVRNFCCKTCVFQKEQYLVLHRLEHEGDEALYMYML